MPGWYAQRFTHGDGVPRFAVRVSLAALLALGTQVACHKKNNNDDNTSQPPIVSYQTPVMLATAGELFTSVPAAAETYITINGIKSTTTTGFSFSISPSLPAGMSLDATTGAISGTPSAVSAAAPYVVTAWNGVGYNQCSLSFGVQASSGLSLTYGGAGAVSGVVGGALVLPGPAASLAIPEGSGFGVAPALPAGLSLNPDTGAVTGTPAGAVQGSTHTVTLSTPQGSANAAFTLVVAAAAPTAPLGLTYDAGPFTAVAGQAFAISQPTSAGTSLVFTVSPTLPAGLALDPLTGAVAGTPTAATAQATYTVTARNASGASTADLAITVSAAP
jgi:hypothetical protein